MLVASSSALDISRLLGLGGSTDEAKEEAKEPASPTEQRQILQQLGNLGSALNPLNAVSAALNNFPLPELSTILRRKEATKTIFIQVTSTLTRHPVCMTAIGVKPPCAALAVTDHHGHDDHETGGENEAYYVGQGSGLLNGDLVHNPLLGYGGVAPGPHSYHTDEEEDWDFRGANLEGESFEIKPTAAVRMPEATAQFELSRDKRDTENDVELDGSVVPEPEGQLENARPHPRYLLGAPIDLAPITVTKTLYMTKVEKYTDHRVTATVLAHNCIPEHIPFCPAGPKPLVIASPVPVPYPVYVDRHGAEGYPQYNPYEAYGSQGHQIQHIQLGPGYQHGHQQGGHPQGSHQQGHQHGHQQGLRPGHWTGKDSNAEKLAPVNVDAANIAA